MYRSFSHRPTGTYAADGDGAAFSRVEIGEKEIQIGERAPQPRVGVKDERGSTSIAAK